MRGALLACGAALVMPAAASAADEMYAVTRADRLITFNSSSPANIQRDVALTGLAAGEHIIAIDLRPQTGALYGLGITSRIYQINPATGALQTIGQNNPFGPPLGGTAFGFDFNPVFDRIRIVSDTGQDLRLNPNTGQTTSIDPTLTYAPGDAGAGKAPHLTAIAHANNVHDARITLLLGIDTARDTLVGTGSPNFGVLRTVGKLGVNATDPASLDIGGDGSAFAAFALPGQKLSQLYKMNLTTGRATLAAPRATIGTTPVRSITIAGPAAPDHRAPVVSVAISTAQSESRLLARGLRPSISCDEECVLTATAQVKGLRAGAGTVTIVRHAGRRTLPIRLNNRARAFIRRKGTLRISLAITATDSAGNHRTVRRVIRTTT